MKILLVEDEKDLSKALAAILSKNNYSVDCALDGEDATDFLESYSYDLVILDIMLPKKNGIEVLKDFRKTNKTCPVIILSAKTEIKDKIDGLDNGADDYLAKPFEIDELLARIRALIRRKADKIVTELTFGNVSLDRNACLISTEFGCEKLVNKELQIIELFMLNPNEVFSSEFIINNVWNSDSYSIDNNLWVFLSYLRKKLAKIKANIVIKNYRNIGYCLELNNEKN